MLSVKQPRKVTLTNNLNHPFSVNIKQLQVHDYSSFSSKDIPHIRHSFRRLAGNIIPCLWTCKAGAKSKNLLEIENKTTLSELIKKICVISNYVAKQGATSSIGGLINITVEGVLTASVSSIKKIKTLKKRDYNISANINLLYLLSFAS